MSWQDLEGSLLFYWQGFLGGQALKFIGGLITGNKNALTEVRDTLLKNLKFIIPIFLALTGTLGIITRSLVRLGFRIAGSAFRNLLMRPITYLLRMAGAAATGLLNGVRNTPLPPTTTTWSKETKDNQGRTPTRRPNTTTGGGGGGFRMEFLVDLLGETLPGKTSTGLGMGISPFGQALLTNFLLNATGGIIHIEEKVLLTVLLTKLVSKYCNLVKLEVLIIFIQTKGKSDATKHNFNFKNNKIMKYPVIPATSRRISRNRCSRWSANDIPLFNTTNRDNFYLMYSMIQYNIQPELMSILRGVTKNLTSLRICRKFSFHC